MIDTPRTDERWETLAEALQSDSVRFYTQHEAEEALASLRAEVDQLKQERAEADAHGLVLAAEVERLSAALEDD